MRGRVRSLSRTDRVQYDRLIGASLARLDCYRRATQVLAYRALSDEVDLAAVLDRACADGKLLFLPVVAPDLSLTYRRWMPGQELRQSAFGVDEPADGAGPDDIPTILVAPGLAFDGRGGRLGRGKGCYDRTLARWTDRAVVVGVAYHCQIVDRLPCDLHDRRVDMVVSENGVFGLGSPE